MLLHTMIHSANGLVCKKMQAQSTGCSALHCYSFVSAPTKAQPFAYISNQLGDSVSVIDTESVRLSILFQFPASLPGLL